MLDILLLLLCIGSKRTLKNCQFKYMFLSDFICFAKEMNSEEYRLQKRV